MRLIDSNALAALVIWGEAENQEYQGKIAVGEVIRRRTAMKFESDGTIEGTILLRYQFSEFNDDRQDNARLIEAFQLDTSNPVVAECIRAWSDSEASNVVPGAVQYYNPKTSNPAWASSPEFVMVGQVGNHRFFRRA